MVPIYHLEMILEMLFLNQINSFIHLFFVLIDEFLKELQGTFHKILSKPFLNHLVGYF